eukprot:scaffold762_cov363-Pavlova_lutheri.AAC.76
MYVVFLLKIDGVEGFDFCFCRSVSRVIYDVWFSLSWSFCCTACPCLRLAILRSKILVFAVPQFSSPAPCLFFVSALALNFGTSKHAWAQAISDSVAVVFLLVPFRSVCTSLSRE